jgi:hypothetical protein
VWCRGAALLLPRSFTGVGNEKYFFAKEGSIGTPPDWTNFPEEAVNTVSVTFNTGQSVALENQRNASDFSAKVPQAASAVTKVVVNFGPEDGNPNLTWP